jgi:glycosyltransferase involved in cell wall biosynthesis
MKPVFLSFLLYDSYYRKEMASHPGDPDYFDREILAHHPDPVQKWCKMLLDRFGTAEFWYLSAYSKTEGVFRHDYGHTLRRIPGFNMSKYLTRFGACEWSWQLFRHLRREQVTHLMVLTYIKNPLLPLDIFDLVALEGRRRGIRVFPVFGGGSILWYRWPRRSLKLATLKRTAGILCQSKAEVGVMVGPCGFPADKIHHFNNPLDLEEFHPEPREICAARTALPAEFRYILFIGRFVQAKGIHHLTRVFQSLAKDDPSLRLLLVGWGPLEPELREEAAGGGVADRILFLPQLSHEVLRYYYGLAEVFVLPSYTEGTPNVLLEAIACGTPSVATAVGGIPDLLKGNLGLVVEPRDERGLEIAIRKVLSGEFTMDPGVRSALLDDVAMDHKALQLERILGAT